MVYLIAPMILLIWWSVGIAICEWSWRREFRQWMPLYLLVLAAWAGPFTIALLFEKTPTR